MNAMICEMCGSHDLIKQDGVYVCQHCGTKYTVEEARKLLGTVKIDKTEETQKYLLLARRAREERNNENTEKYYNLVLQEEPNNWEAAYYSVHAKVSQCVIRDINSAAIQLFSCVKSTYALIKETIQEADSCAQAYSQITDDATGLFVSLYIGAENHYLGIDDGIRANYRQEFLERAELLAGLLKKLADELDNCFNGEEAVAKNKVMAWKCAINVYYRCDNAVYSSDIEQLTEKIKFYEPDYERPNYLSGRGAAMSGGCYVATAVYGSYDCPQVWTLRRFRDNTLAETWYGRAFIRAYYAISPTLVKWFGKTEWFKNLWKPTLDRMVEKLNGTGVEDTPYDDRAW